MTPQPMFVGLAPDPQLHELIWHYKHQVKDLVGDQLFLNDPPHLTAYLALFSSPETVLKAIATKVDNILRPEFMITGWHVFEADPLNGNNTLVCEIDEPGVGALRVIQAQVIQSVADLRDREATAARFRPRHDTLSGEQQACVSAVGFPYVGAGWHPHFTIASIRPADWEAVSVRLLSVPPTMQASCPQLKVYKLIDEKPQVIATYSLS